MGDEEIFKFYCQYQYLGTCYICLLQKADIEAYGVIFVRFIIECLKLQNFSSGYFDRKI